MSKRNDKKKPVAKTEPPSAEPADFVMERFGNLRDTDRSFDIDYWQRQGDAAIYRAAWELAVLYHRAQGMGPDEFRLDKSIEHFERSSDQKPNQ